MVVGTDQIVAISAIDRRMAIGADDIVARAGIHNGLAIGIDHIVAGAGIDRDGLGIGPDGVVTATAEELEKVQTGVRSCARAAARARSVGEKGIDLRLQLIDDGPFLPTPGRITVWRGAKW